MPVIDTLQLFGGLIVIISFLAFAAGRKEFRIVGLIFMFLGIGIGFKFGFGPITTSLTIGGVISYRIGGGNF